MATKYDFTTAARLAMELESELSPKEVGIALTVGINKAAIGVRARMTKELTQDFNVKSKAMKTALPIEKASFRIPEANINIDGASIPLLEFVTPASKRALEAKERTSKGDLKPVKVKVFKGKPVVTLPHVFYESKSKYIAERIEKGKGSGRGPLQGKYGPSIATQATKVYEDIEDFATETAQKRIAEEINYRILKIESKLGLK